MKKIYTHTEPLHLESGIILPELEIAFHTFGKINSSGSNVIWVFHALTANSDPSEWWSGLVGEKQLFNPEDHFIVCANIIGSCYGSSGPLSLNPKTGRTYFSSFPEITIKDMVRAHDLLRQHLAIEKIKFGLGGSMGGYQLLQWATLQPNLFQNIILLATSAKESAWGIAIHTTQRLAIETDSSWRQNHIEAGRMGLKTARGIGMLTYRNYQTFVNTQSDFDNQFGIKKASSYIHYQGEKLANRFNAFSYWLLTKAMDDYALGETYSEIEFNLSQISSKCLIIGIDSDLLCPIQEQQFLNQHLKNSKLEIIQSNYGHDGFLIEFEKTVELILSRFSKEIR